MALPYFILPNSSPQSRQSRPAVDGRDQPVSSNYKSTHSRSSLSLTPLYKEGGG